MTAGSRSEALFEDRWWRIKPGGARGFTDLVLPRAEAAPLPGEVRRLVFGTTVCARVPNAVIKRRIRITASTVFQSVPAVVAQVIGDRAELYNGTGEAGREGWEGNMHDGWSKWVPVSELGEVTESVQEFDAEGNRLP